MTDRIKELLAFLKSKDYRNLRIDNEIGEVTEEMKTATCKIDYFCDFLSKEKPIIFENDRIGFHRYQKKVPSFELAWGNFVADYEFFLKNGFYGIYNLLESKRNSADSEKLRFINDAQLALNAVFDLMKRYKKIAQGEMKEALENLLKGAPATFLEALICVKIMNYTLRVNCVNHVTLGRFDQYMHPFYKSDLEKGKTKEYLFELTEEFFINLNFDTDIYFGAQQGDNGQSMMLGGYDKYGNDCFNEFSEVCMNASLELRLIDPKINLRVSKKTPDSIYRFGTLMTKQGLGFPQYSNDDVVIPGLLKIGHSKEEAHNYSVAACWEFIMPNRYDITNYSHLNYLAMVDTAVKEHLTECKSFDELLQYVYENIEKRANKMLEFVSGYEQKDDTYYSLFFKYSVEECREYHRCGVPCNFGCHGTGLANAADSLAAIKKTVFEEKTLSAEKLLAVLEANFEGYEEIRNTLLACPKLGNNDDYVDLIAVGLMEKYSSCFAAMRLSDGGYMRPGTGSAQTYIKEGSLVGATADGRFAAAPLSASHSPSITAHTAGLLSVLQSLTKFDLSRIINGGPTTIEIHEQVFRNDYGIDKVAELVKIFVELGGHQLQLNSISRETLLEAQKHPELHPDLIVRVWGWSGYFNELDVEFQNHIISRTEYTV